MMAHLTHLRARPWHIHHLSTRSWHKMIVITWNHKIVVKTWNHKIIVYIAKFFLENQFLKLKFSFSKKATNLKQSPTWFDVYLANVKSSKRLFQIFVVFSECPKRKKSNKENFLFPKSKIWQNCLKYILVLIIKLEQLL